MVTGAVGGGLNPAGSLGSSIMSGTIAGTTEGVILANNVDSNGRINPWVSAAAGLTGSFAGGVASSGMAGGNFGKAFTHGAVKAFSAIPSELIGVGVNHITKDMDKQDAFMVRQAFSGLKPIAGVVYKHGLGLDDYTGSNGLVGTRHQSSVIEPIQTYDTSVSIPKTDYFKEYHIK